MVRWSSSAGGAYRDQLLNRAERPSTTLRAGSGARRKDERGKSCGRDQGMFWLYNLSMARTLSLEKILEVLRQQIPMLAERYSVEKLEVFGSYVRSEQKKDSDLDILVTFKEAPSLLTFIAIENYLSDLLGVKVDLVMKDSLKPKIGQWILREAIPV